MSGSASVGSYWNNHRNTFEYLSLFRRTSALSCCGATLTSELGHLHPVLLAEGLNEGFRSAEHLGSWLRHERLVAGLTQEELASRSGLGVRTIGDLERGVRIPYPRSLRLVAGALGMSETAADELAAWCRSAGNNVTVLARTDANGHSDELPSAPVAGEPVQAGRDLALVPRQLPAASAYFAGRAAELATLDGWAEQVPAVNGAVTISVICGMAGVGKTALALRWAHRAARHFPDGQLYVNLRGYGPGRRPADSAEVIRSFLGALGVAPWSIPADRDAQAALYRSVLADKRMLIVADNARDAAQVRMLLPGAPGCLVLATSRSPLIGLVAAEGARVLNLDLPTAAEAAELLTARLGRDWVSAEPVAGYQLISACGRLPLALAVVAARAAATGWPLAALAAELADATERSGVLKHNDRAVNVRAVFSWSYRRLGAASARVFRLLSIHPGPEFSARVVASLAGVPPRAALAALRELADVGLIAEPEPGRYVLHDLLRAYAANRARKHHTGEELQAAAHRMLDHYLHAAAAASKVLDPSQETMPLGPPQPGVTPEVITDGHQALAWFAAEYKVLLAITAQMTEPGFAASTLRLAWTMARFLERNGKFHELVDSQQAALACAERLDDLAGQARTHRHLGNAYTRLGQACLAYAHLTRAMELSQRLRNQAGELRAPLCLGLLLEYLRQLALSSSTAGFPSSSYESSGAAARRSENGRTTGRTWSGSPPGPPVTCPGKAPADRRGPAAAPPATGRRCI